jgi:integrase
MTALTTIQPAKADIIRMIESNPKLADSTKAQYKKAIKNYLATGNSLADSEAISRYAATLSKSSKAFLKSAIRLWTERVALQAKSQSTPETVNAVTATLHRLDAINESIRVEQSKGQKAHTWLTQTEVKQLLNHCDDTITGKRDRVVLSLLLGAGPRRSELAALTFDSIKMQGDRSVLEVTGKGAKDRVIPVSDRLAQLLTEWQQIAGDGYIARSLGMNRELGESLSDVQIFRIVRAYGGKMGKPELAAHDLRRTYAQLGFEAGVPITQISKLLTKLRLKLY